MAGRRPACNNSPNNDNKIAGGASMKTMIVLFNLKPGQSEADYEKWAKEVDIPTVTGLKSVQDFKVFRSEGIFGSDAKPPYRYVEVLQVTSAEGLGADVGNSPAMADIIAKFGEIADSPAFMVTEQIA
jgi:hypothetical protein